MDTSSPCGVSGESRGPSSVGRPVHTPLLLLTPPSWRYVSTLPPSLPSHRSLHAGREHVDSKQLRMKINSVVVVTSSPHASLGRANAFWGTPVAARGASEGRRAADRPPEKAGSRYDTAITNGAWLPSRSRRRRQQFVQMNSRKQDEPARTTRPFRSRANEAVKCTQRE